MTQDDPIVVSVLYGFWRLTLPPGIPRSGILVRSDGATVALNDLGRRTQGGKVKSEQRSGRR
jgi:hypothetical protein